MERYEREHAQKKTKQQLVINQNSFILIEKRAEMKYFNYMNCVCKWIVA